MANVVDHCSSSAAACPGTCPSSSADQCPSERCVECGTTQAKGFRLCVHCMEPFCPPCSSRHRSTCAAAAEDDEPIPPFLRQLAAVWSDMENGTDSGRSLDEANHPSSASSASTQYPRGVVDGDSVDGGDGLPSDGTSVGSPRSEDGPVNSPNPEGSSLIQRRTVRMARASLSTTQQRTVDEIMANTLRRMTEHWGAILNGAGTRDAVAGLVRLCVWDAQCWG